MKIRSIFILTILISNQLYCAKYSDKNFVSMKSQTSNLALEYSIWHNLISDKEYNKYKGKLQIIPFYRDTTNKNDLGKYFGFNWGGTRGIEDILSTAPNDNSTVLDSTKILLFFIILI